MASMYEIEKAIEDIIRRVDALAEYVGITVEPEPSIEQAIPIEHLENPPEFVELFEQKLQNIAETIQELTDPDA